MMPFGGLSMLFHLALISFQHKKKVLLSLLIVLGVAVILGAIFFNSLRSISRGNATLSSFLNWFNRCRPIEMSRSGKQVVLRLDDVQAFTWREVTIKMINEALGKEIPLVAGVIPVEISEDQELFQFLKEKNCNLEIAQHGWNHQDNPPEFADLDEETAYQKIIQGKTVLQEITADPLLTFIPPQNLYSEGTKKALEKAGFQIISGEGEGRFDYTVSTYDFLNKRLNPVAEVVSQCQDGLEKNNLCIIMIHPQDYATDGQLDEQKYQTYSELLTELKKLEVAFVKMKDLKNSGEEKVFSKINEKINEDEWPFSAWIPWWDEDRVLTSLKEAEGKLSLVLPVWYRLQEDGRIVEIETAGKPGIINTVRSLNLALIPAITNDFDDQRVALLLGDQALKEREIENLVKIAQTSGYRGWDLDWEEIAENDREAYVEFVGLLAQRLHEENLLLSVSVHAQTGQDNQEISKGQDWPGLGSQADFIRIMAYDFHQADSEPGPVTPPDKLEEVLQYAISALPQEKIVLGLPTYGYDWGAGEGESFQYDDILERLDVLGGSWNREADSWALKGSYILDGVEHVLWFEDGESLAQKIALARSYGINQFCLWRLGGEDGRIWEKDL